MLRWALHHVRMIRYYSATRRRTVWTTAMDVALAGAVAMAWPTVWVADQFYIRTDPTVVVRGKVYQNPAGAFMASVSGDDIPIELVRDSVFYANFEFSIASERRGWPFVTSHRRPQPVLEMEIFSTRQRRWATKATASQDRGGWSSGFRLAVWDRSARYMFGPIVRSGRKAWIDQRGRSQFPRRSLGTCG